MICKIAGWVLGGVQFGVLVMVLFEPLVMPRGLGVLGYAVWVLAQVLLWGVQVTVPAHFCKIGGRVLGMQSGRCCFGMVLGVHFEVLVMVLVHVCEIDGRVLWECCSG